MLEHSNRFLLDGEERLSVQNVSTELLRSIEALAEHWERPVGHVVKRLLSRGLRDAEMMGVCRDCGCTDFDPCVAGDGWYRCSWVAEDLCSFCADLGDVSGEPVEGEEGG